MISLQPIIAALRRGRMIILTDSQDRENEGDLVLAAEKVTPAKIAFMACFGRGLICVPLPLKRATALKLPLMTSKNTSPYKCQFTVSVDAKKAIATGISAFDRARTIRTLLDPHTKHEDLVRPGHIFPLIGHPEGILGRKGHTEGALELMHLAKLSPLAIICEIMGDNGKMLKGAKLRAFARRHNLSIVSIDQLTEYHLSKNSCTFKEPAVQAYLPTRYGIFRARVYKTYDSKEHLALIMGNIDPQKPILVRMHSECLTGDVFHSIRCDCERQLEQGLKTIVQEKNGVFLYLRHEGRGIGLMNKLKAYQWQDEGLDTVEANKKLGFQPDERDYSVGAFILKNLGISSVRLITNNPLKIEGLKASGISVVERIPIELKARGNREKRYLKVKKVKLGHILEKV